MKKIFLFLLISSLFFACRPSNPIPKPNGYFKINLPEEHIYQTFDSLNFPYSFEYPIYARITQDSNLIKRENEPYWVNVYFPDLDATIYLSYSALKEKDNLDNLIAASYKMSFAHDIKADYIKTPPFETPNGLYGILFNVGGNAASAYQFFITDTTKNFLRGALYFNVAPNVDSLKPSIDFLKTDIDHLISTFQFKKKH